MAVLLSGIVISREEEKQILNSNLDDDVVLVNENNRPVRDSGALEETQYHQSQECKEEMIQEDAEMQTASSLDGVKKDAYIANAVLQNPEVQGKEIYDNGLCESENFLPSEKDCSKQDGDLQKIVEVRVDEQQKVSIYGTYTNIIA
jgi:hypothetical protein